MSDANDDHRTGHFQQLLQGARAGNPDDLGELLEIIKPQLLAYARRLIAPVLKGKFSDADLVQETMVLALESFPGFHGRSEAELTAWLLVIQLHRYKSIWRHFCRTAKCDVFREQSLDDNKTWVVLQHALVAHVPAPDCKAIRREEKHSYREARARLPPLYRKVIGWRLGRKLSYADIAQRLGRTEEAARKLCERCMGLLDNEINPLAVDAEGTTDNADEHG